VGGRHSAARGTGILDGADTRRIDVVRGFNRFYTRQMGLLNEHLLRSPFSLTEARVLYELAHGGDWTAGALGQALGIDPAHLSRMLARFRRAGLVTRSRSVEDGRRQTLALTMRGRTAARQLEADAREEVAGLLGVLGQAGQDRLTAAMSAIREALEGSETRSDRRVVIRQPQPGDLGWVVERHGTLYFQEYGWNAEFETLVAGIVARFAERFDSAVERCWIAEVGGRNVGCIFLVRKSKTVARLRMLLVDPSARGLGIGGRLVDECLAFARAAGYRRVTLWTNSVLVAARRLYERAGFCLTSEEPFRGFGHDLVSQTWDLDL